MSVFGKRKKNIYPCTYYRKKYFYIFYKIFCMKLYVLYESTVDSKHSLNMKSQHSTQDRRYLGPRDKPSNLWT